MAASGIESVTLEQVRSELKSVTFGEWKVYNGTFSDASKYAYHRSSDGVWTLHTGMYYGKIDYFLRYKQTLDLYKIVLHGRVNITADTSVSYGALPTGDFFLRVPEYIHLGVPSADKGSRYDYTGYCVQYDKKNTVCRHDPISVINDNGLLYPGIGTISPSSIVYKVSAFFSNVYIDLRYPTRIYPI